LGLLVGIILAIPVVILMMPIILSGMVAAITDTAFIFTGGIVITLALLALYIPLAILIGGILRTYIGSAWTLTYLQLGKPVAVES
jgi:hypothetical protein